MKGDPNKILGDPWYDHYYPNFYDNMYSPEISDYNTYLGGGKTKWNTEFWEWFSNTYLLKDVYPLKYYPSGSYF